MNYIVKFYSSFPNSFEMLNAILPEWPAEFYSENTTEYEERLGMPEWVQMTKQELDAHFALYKQAKENWNIEMGY